MEDNQGVEDIYVYLEFNGKINETIQNDVYMRIDNLETSTPFVQINDYIFKGSYEENLGTNLFFEETDEESSDAIFETHTPLNLKHCVTQTKILNLKQMKVLPKKVDVPNLEEPIMLNFNLDYQTLLSKLEDGTLTLEESAVQGDIDNVQTPNVAEDNTEVTPDEISSTLKDQPHVEIADKSIEVEKVLENFPEKSMDEERLEAKYRKLKELAMRPVKRDTPPEVVEECEAKYKQAYEYKNLEAQVLQPSDFFRETSVKIDNNLREHVDIDRCILYGIIPSDADLLQYESQLLNLNNFNNISLAARYCVLKKQVKELEEFVNSASEGKLKVRDEFGRTPIETLEIYKKLTCALNNRLSGLATQ